MIAVKWSTPNIPKLLSVNVPPMNSEGCSLFSFAFTMSSPISEAIYSSPLLSARFTIGVISPLSVCTATDISTSEYSRIKSPIHDELVSGTAFAASAAALISSTFTDNF